MRIKSSNLKPSRIKEKVKLLVWSVFSATLLTLFVSILTVDVDPSFFDLKGVSNDILGVNETLYKVVRVSDGDTFVIEKDGVQEKIRLLGIDAPESRDPRKPVECFSMEASARLHELLDNQFVSLKDDPTQMDKDRYGRLLRYVYLPDGTFLNELLLKEGYAFEYTYESKPYELVDRFVAAETEAQVQGRGLWGPSGCLVSSR
jgi:micrococcal nuclease